jgi:hypothetical protein
MFHKRRALRSSLVLLVSLVACGGGFRNNNSINEGEPVPAPSSAFEHVAIVFVENQNYLDVIGNSSMPFFNGLAQRYSLATEFYANSHPSIGNYFMMTTGKIVSTDDNFAGSFRGDNVARQLTVARKTWKVYAESLPAAGYIGGDQYPYIKHHNPFAYFDDVRNNSAQRANILPLTQFSRDLLANALPNYSFIVPNNLHNGHDCPSGGTVCSLSERLSAIDSWLDANISPLVSNASFMNNGVLILTFDESGSDNTMGGGRIPVLFVGGRIKRGFQSTAKYQFPNLLRFSLESLGVTTYPGAAANAVGMNEFVK